MVGPKALGNKKIKIKKGKKMAKFSTISKAASAAILGAVLLTGCGSSDTSTTSGGVSGVVVKGYLGKARVWADHNGDKAETSDEITETDSNGKYSFTKKPGKNTVIKIKGGSYDGSVFKGSLKTVFKDDAKKVVATPLTILVASVVEGGGDVDAAETQIGTQLGLTAAQLTQDPIEEAQKADGNTSMLEKSLYVAGMIELAAAGTSDEAGSYDGIAAAIANQLNANVALATAVQPSSIMAEDASIVTATTNAAATNLSTALAAISITAGSTADEIKAKETTVKVATGMVVGNAAAQIDMVNLEAVVRASIASADANSTLSLNVDALATALQGIDTTDSAFDANATATAVEATTLVDTDTLEEQQNTEIAEAIVASAKAQDSLKLVDNKFTIGSQATTISDGTFTSVLHDTITNSSEIAALYDVSFGLENLVDGDSNAYASLEDGDDKNVTIALKIDSSDSRKLLAIVENVSLSRVDTDSNTSNYNGDFKIAVNDATTLSAWSINSNGGTQNANNISLDNACVTSVDGVVSVSVENIINSLSSNTSFATSIDSIKNSFGVNGAYTVSLFISGVDSVVGSADSSVSDVYTGFAADQNETISESFSGAVSKIYGDVNIGLTAQEVIDLNNDAVALEKTNLEVSHAGTSALPTESNVILGSATEGTVITWATSNEDVVSAAGVINQTSSVGTAILTATITKGDASVTKPFTVTVAAEVSLIPSGYTQDTTSGNLLNVTGGDNAELYVQTVKTHVTGTSELLPVNLNLSDYSLMVKVIGEYAGDTVYIQNGDAVYSADLTSIDAGGTGILTLVE